MVLYCCQCGNALPNRRVKNPHNPKDEFCSQECAKLDRIRYLEVGPKSYLLYAEGSLLLLGVYRSMPALLRGGSYQEYVHKVANQTLGKLFYEVWMDDYPQEKKEWEYLPVLTVTSFRKK